MAPDPPDPSDLPDVPTDVEDVADAEVPPREPAIDPAKAALARARAAARDRRADGAVPPRSGGSRGAAARTSSTRRGRPVDPDEVPRSGPAPDGRDPQRLAAAVESLVSARGWEAEAAVGGLVGRWVQIVGPEVAAHVSVETYEADAGRLVLRADSTAWATQLRLLLPTLTERLRAELGAAAVRDVGVLGPAAPSWKKGPRSVPGRGPRDTYG